MAKRIETVGLSCYYGGLKAVDDVNIVIEPKSVTAFIGPSGCGKSTFLRALNRMHEVIPGARIDGTVLLDDEDIYDPRVDPSAVRRSIGVVHALELAKAHGRTLTEPDQVPPGVCHPGRREGHGVILTI